MIRHMREMNDIGRVFSLSRKLELLCVKPNIDAQEKLISRKHI